MPLAEFAAIAPKLDEKTDQVASAAVEQWLHLTHLCLQINQITLETLQIRGELAGAWV